MLKLRDVCPICLSPATCVAVEEQNLLFVECSSCTTFTIDDEMQMQVASARARNDVEELLAWEAVSRYLRAAGDDDARDVNAQTWGEMAAAGGPDDDSDS
jgi:hypothetical protein